MDNVPASTDPRGYVETPSSSLRDSLSMGYSVDVDSLRALIHDALSKKMYSSAIFFADKLLTLTHNSTADVYLLANALYLDQQYKRAVHLLRQASLLSPAEDVNGEDNVPFQYLGGMCFKASKSWEECLIVIGDDENTAVERFLPSLPPSEGHVLDSAHIHAQASTPFRSLDIPSSSAATSSASSSSSFSSSSSSASSSSSSSFSIPSPSASNFTLSSAICLLRAQSFDALENTRKAAYWYSRALHFDVKCYDAFHQLVNKRLLRDNEAKLLLAQLESRCSPGCEWVLLLYASMIGVEMWENHTQAAAGKTGLLALSESECISENVRLLEDLGLKENGDILMARATSAYKENAFKTCYKYSKTLIERDPFNLSILPVHICTLVELELKSELFYLSHQLVDSYPENGVTWFSVGCYYYLIQRFDMARRLFNKATTLEPPFLSGWIAYGHSFSLQDESDQAIAAYRTAARLFEGNHAALLFIGMEYAKSGNSLLAQQFFQQAMLMHVKDPMVYNEMGVIAFRDGLYEDAVSLFLQTLEKARGHNLEEWEPTLFNLGHAFRKVLRYDDAIHYYEMALSVSAKKYSVESALGFTHHLKGDLDKAIEYYHRALSTQPRETFTSDMLGRALSQFADTPVSDL